jgi:glycosyltransferase involved in cell wall biosynthesis
MKNYGAALAGGNIIAFIDADCVPTTDWLERIAKSIDAGAEVVVGKTRYRNDKPLASTFSVFDFGHVQGDGQGRANYFNANNLAFRAEVIRHNKYDEQVRRNGACYHLWQRLAQQKRRMVYDAGLFAAHGYDIEGWGFVPKHLERGFDMIRFFQLDENKVFSGSRYMRLGIFAPMAMAISRVWFDFKRIVFNRGDLGIRWYAIPYFYVMSLIIRPIEMLGGMLAIVNPNYYQSH